jgi:uncharacterized protein (DUF885 family)
MTFPWFFILALGTAAVSAPGPNATSDTRATVPPIATLAAVTTSELADVVNRYSADEASLNRRYDAPDSPDRRRRMRAFYSDWRARLAEFDFGRLSQEGKVDYVLLDNTLIHELALLDRADTQRAETAALLPFADRLLALQDSRRELEPMDARAAARTIFDLTKQVDSLRSRVESSGAKPAAVSAVIARRAADNLDQLRATLRAWFRFYDGYDPMFSWWVHDPESKLDDALNKYARTLRERIVGMKVTEAPAGRGGGDDANRDDNTGPIIGDPIGARGLAEDLRFEMIPYSPEELIAIAQKEYAFSLAEMKKASREMGFGDDWKAALEKVKNTYVDPGKQPELIRDLAHQAEAFFDQHDWVTIPPLAREDWRMEMMSPERQRVAPFFLGGEQILVSYPTDAMSDEDKRMSLRGNNPHFSHATVFHELNPGHHLQGFMTARYNPHRRLFVTPFWNEGNSLYWEMFLWDHGFQVSPEDRVGALFWRMHRSARIIFSLSFHLGKMTPPQAVQFLVDTVGFERANAEGEVRRSFGGQYSPLYQVAYMIGGLEFRALHKELVDSRRMTEREFHDAILMGGPMPVAMVRARLAKVPLERSGPAPWRFADALPAPVPAPVK